MLRISAEQLQGMRDEREQDFRHRLAEFLAPAQAVGQPADTARAMAAALSGGARSERDVAAFALASELLGDGFEQRLPAARRAVEGSANALGDFTARVAEAAERTVANPSVRDQLRRVLEGDSPAAATPDRVLGIAVPEARTRLDGARAVQRAVDAAGRDHLSLRGLGRQAVEAVEKRVDDAADRLIDRVTRPVREIRDEALALPGDIGKAVDDTIADMRAVPGQVIDAMAKEGEDMLSEVGDAARSGADDVVKALEKQGQAILDGCRPEWPEVRAAIGDAVQGVIDAARGVLESFTERMIGAARKQIEAAIDRVLERVATIRKKVEALIGRIEKLADGVRRAFRAIEALFGGGAPAGLIASCPRAAPAGGGGPAPAPSATPPLVATRPPTPPVAPRPVPTPGLPRGPVMTTPLPARPGPRPSAPPPAPPRATPQPPPVRPGPSPLPVATLPVVPGSLSPPAPPPPPSSMTEAERAELMELSQDLGQMGLDIVGIFDPTGAADIANAGWSALRGDWLGAGISVVSALVPYLGDLAKLGRLPRITESVLRAQRMMAASPAAHAMLERPMAAIRTAMARVDPAKLPGPLRDQVTRLRNALDAPPRAQLPAPRPPGQAVRLHPRNGVDPDDAAVPRTSAHQEALDRSSAIRSTGQPLSHPNAPGKAISADDQANFATPPVPTVTRGPATLYRVVGDGSNAAGPYWLERMPESLDGFRADAAVPQRWNGDGGYVEMHIPAGVEVPVWRGPAAVQESVGGGVLPGGGTQLFLDGQSLPRGVTISEVRPTPWNR